MSALVMKRRRHLAALAVLLFGLLFGAAQAAVPVGHVSKLQGVSEALNEGAKRPLGPQAPINQNDLVSTSAGARLEIVLDDGTLLTLGEKSTLTIDAFLYNPSDADNHLAATIVGAFQFVSGKIPHDRPDQVLIHTPIATIGIRGTNFWSGPIDGHYGVLLRAGAVAVTTRAGAVLLNEPGEGTDLGRRSVPPGPVRQWPQSKVERALATIRFEDDRGAREETWRNLYRDALPVLDARYRFEGVDQASQPKNAQAHTLRTRLGLQSGQFYGLGIGADLEWIQAIGAARFDDTIHGRTEFPVVADPNDLEINQLYLSADNTIPMTTLTLGRQRIVWDDGRFIGDVGFRQNQQTFDAFRGIVTALPDTELEYAYLDEVRRITGSHSATGHFGLHGHGLRARYSGIEGLNITPFTLLLDFASAAWRDRSSVTYGLLLDGDRAIDADWGLLYTASLARQYDFGDNPAHFGLWYYRLEPGLSYRGVEAKLGYEVLQGDGVSAFRTPLATGHEFNGLTDQFLTTPATGLADLLFALNAPLPGGGWLSDLMLKLGYHQFWAEQDGSHYGSEWHAGLFKTVALNDGDLLLGLQFARYEADRFSSDTDKLWATVQFTLGAWPLRQSRQSP